MLWDQHWELWGRRQESGAKIGGSWAKIRASGVNIGGHGAKIKGFWVKMALCSHDEGFCGQD